MLKRSISILEADDKIDSVKWITCHHSKFSHLDNQAPRICAPMA